MPRELPFSRPYLGPELEFTDDAMVAVTGAAIATQARWPFRGVTWTLRQVKRGQKLSFDFLKKGARASLLSQRNRWPVVLGSTLDLRAGRLGSASGSKARCPSTNYRRCGYDRGQGAVRSGRIGASCDGDINGVARHASTLLHRITDAAGRGFFSDP